MTSPIDRTGRFQDAERGQSVLAGFQKASRDPVNKKFIKRQLKPYQKYGVPKYLTQLKGLSDTDLEIMAVKAILKKKGIKPKKLRTKLNRQKFGPKRIKNAKRVMAKKQSGKKVNKQVLQNTRDVRRHISRIRANRRAMKLPLWRA